MNGAGSQLASKRFEMIGGVTGLEPVTEWPVFSLRSILSKAAMALPLFAPSSDLEPANAKVPRMTQSGPSAGP